MGNQFEFTTKLWQRGQNSHASTIPREILAIKGVPTENDVSVKWRINQDSGAVEVRFETEVNDE